MGACTALEVGFGAPDIRQLVYYTLVIRRIGGSGYRRIPYAPSLPAPPPRFLTLPFIVAVPAATNLLMAMSVGRYPWRHPKLQK